MTQPLTKRRTATGGNQSKALVLVEEDGGLTLKHMALGTKLSLVLVLMGMKEKGVIMLDNPQVWLEREAGS